MAKKEIVCPFCGAFKPKLVGKYTTVHVYQCVAPKCRRKFDVDAMESKESMRADKADKPKKG